MEHHYSGRWYTTNGGYNGGGAGYVFSKQTLLRVIKEMKSNNKNCKVQPYAEDIWVSRCLESFNVSNTDTTDEMGLDRFHQLQPEFFLLPGAIPSNNFLYNCCSIYSISWHKMTENYHYSLEFFIYRQQFHTSYYKLLK